jgi:hypothetical protein
MASFSPSGTVSPSTVVLGYCALYVDYVQGEGHHRYEFDMPQHGLLDGVSARF